MISGISILDIIVILFVIISGIIAFVDGVITESLTVVSWIVSIFIVKFIYPYVAPNVVYRVGESYQVIASVGLYVVLFVLSVFILSFVVSRIQKIVHMTAFKAPDKLLGFLFGIIRGFLLAVGFYIFLLWFIPNPDERPNWIIKARLRPYLSDSAKTIMDILPKGPAFNEIRLLIKIDQEINYDLSKHDKDNQALIDEISDTEKISFDDVTRKNPNDKSSRKERIDKTEIRALKNTMQILKDAEDIEKSFINE